MVKPGAKSMAANRWTCDICQKDMHLNDQERHLSGLSHKRLALTAERNHNLPQSTTNDVNAGAKNEPTGPWTCDICQKRMYMSNQESHLAGRLHLERLALTAQQNHSPSQSTTSDVNAGTKNEPENTGIRSNSSGPSWKCYVCDSDRIPVKEKAAHRATAEHRRRLGISTNDAGPSRGTGHSGGPKAGPAGSGGSGGGSGGRPSGSGGAPGGSGPGHGGGGGGGGGPGPPKSTSRRNRRAPRRPTLEDSDYDSDDLRGLLYDIDTQWGLLPHGDHKLGFFTFEICFLVARAKRKIL